jgi:hypothetical protein
MKPSWLFWVSLLACLVSALIGGTAHAAPPIGAAVVRPAREAPAADHPCGLLTSTQLHLLGVTVGATRTPSDNYGAECVWPTRSPAEGGEYLAQIIRGTHPVGTTAASINTLPTSEYDPPDADPRVACGYLVSVTGDETLWARYRQVSNNAAQGMTHQVACNKAQQAASYMASTYFTLPR